MAGPYTDSAASVSGIGDWVSEEGDISFRPDGTFEAAHVFTVTANGSVAKTKQKPYVAQYRWLDRGTIELTLLGKDGGTIRYTRKKTFRNQDRGRRLLQRLVRPASLLPLEVERPSVLTVALRGRRC